MKAGLFFGLFSLITLVPLQAKDATTWSGTYRNQKFLGGTAVFELTILQDGDRISIDFNAAYSDGDGCETEGSGPAKVGDKDTLTFSFTDSSDNSGTGTIKRMPDGVMVSMKPTKVNDPRCVVFYGDSLRLKTAKK